MLVEQFHRYQYVSLFDTMSLPSNFRAARRHRGFYSKSPSPSTMDCSQDGFIPLWSSVTIVSMVLFPLVGVGLFKVYLRYTTAVCSSPEKMHGKTVIITGGNSGELSTTLGASV